jgi:hypothetical protein
VNSDIVDPLRAEPRARAASPLLQRERPSGGVMTDAGGTSVGLIQPKSVNACECAGLVKFCWTHGALEDQVTKLGTPNT